MKINKPSVSCWECHICLSPFNLRSKRGTKSWPCWPTLKAHLMFLTRFLLFAFSLPAFFALIDLEALKLGAWRQCCERPESSSYRKTVTKCFFLKTLTVTVCYFHFPATYHLHHRRYLFLILHKTALNLICLGGWILFLKGHSEMLVLCLIPS